MIKPLVIENILIDLYHNGVYQFTMSDFTSLDVRRQIVKDKLEGYSVKMNPQFWRLFKDDDEIETSEYFITKDGVYSDWFPEYYLNEDYPSMPVFNEGLAAIIKMNKLKRDEK